MRAALLFLALAFPGNCLAQSVLIRQAAPLPAPVTLTGLRALPGPPVPDRACAFAPVSLDSASLKAVALGDSTTLLVPNDWSVLPSQQGNPAPDAIRLGMDGGSIRIARARDASRGRSFIMNSSGGMPDSDTCTFGSDTAGAIWTFYEPDPGAPDQALPFLALGDLIVPDGRWYRVTSFSETADRRDSMVRTFTAVMFR